MIREPMVQEITYETPEEIEEREREEAIIRQSILDKLPPLPPKVVYL